jgi:hypothetical protein
MEDELATVLGERQIAEFIQHHQFGVSSQPVSESSPFVIELFLFELVGQVDEIEELGSVARADCL